MKGESLPRGLALFASVIVLVKVIVDSQAKAPYAKRELEVEEATGGYQSPLKKI